MGKSAGEPVQAVAYLRTSSATNIGDVTLVGKTLRHVWTPALAQEEPSGLVQRAVHLPFGASPLGNGGQAGEKIRRHEQPPNQVAPHGFRPDSARKGEKRPSRRRPRRTSQTER